MKIMKHEETETVKIRIFIGFVIALVCAMYFLITEGIIK